MRPVTFIHISDLHYGFAPQPANLTASARKIAGRLAGTIVGCGLGHARPALIDLERFVRKERLEGRRQGYDVQLIVTGDLTSCGEPTQFEEITQYFARAPHPSGNPKGLDQANWMTYTIPGNHDHWPGTPMIIPGEPTPAFGTSFDSMPSTSPIFSLGCNLPVVRFLRIDTDAGVHAFSPERWYAIGRFKRQLDQLAYKLRQEPPAPEIRILLLHHSVTHIGTTLHIADDSREALDRFILDHDIALLLCGHIHKANLGYHAVSATKKVLEARCGTTAQIGKEDYTMTPGAGDEPVDSRIWRRSLLVHRLYQSAKEIHWEVKVYVHAHAGGFEPAHLLPTGGPVQETVRVWPK
ncbi:MAG: metallophosphoesterase family protein [bacterium]